MLQGVKLMEKKTWETPQLIILARGTPEESVLTVCKTMNPNEQRTGTNVTTYQLTCAAGTENKCDNCLSRGNSGS